MNITNIEHKEKETRGTHKNAGPIAEKSEFELIRKLPRSLEEIKTSYQFDERLEKFEVYKFIFKTTKAAKMIVDENMTVFEVNEEFERQTGYAREEVEGKMKWAEICIKGDLSNLPENGRLQEIDTTSGSRVYELRLMTKQGRIKGINAFIDKIPATNQSVISLFDITDRRQLQDKLKKRERELRDEKNRCGDMNTALKVLLRQREEDKSELEEKILSNIKKLVLPHVDKLKKGRLNSDDMAHIRVMESNLKNIISSFAHKLASKCVNLTHKELQVANYIKEGKTTKEISELMNVSIRAIDVHRYNIRRKLGLNKKRVNLHHHLHSL